MGKTTETSIESRKEALLKTYSDWLRMRNYSDQTYKSYMGTIRNFWKFCESKTGDRSFKKADAVQIYLSYRLHEQKLDYSTVNGDYSALQWFYKYVLNRGWNVRKLIRPRKEKRLPRTISPEQFSQLLELYWELGKELTLRQNDSKWGSKFIERTAGELRETFPQIKGFSRRNLYAMRQWYQFYSQESEFVPQDVAQIPWGHNRLIIGKTKDIEAALFYVKEVIENGWDRDTLEIQIDNRLYEKVGKSVTNFDRTLPESQSELAKQVLKDPYNFDFLGLENDALEQAVEDELVKNITKFLLELGKGFAFMGRQFKIEISETDYFIDLLFYHVELRCYVVVELKAGKFKPEHTGKLNFYLSAVDTQIKSSEDNLTIGILLCKKKDKIEAEYALRDMNKPMGISEYKLTELIPDKIKGKLPSIEELENKLDRIEIHEEE